mmetsp:Transcript_13103/g.29834  ORF Transcript_13103/g.29834 Transcript_13103/m.29834 type:complete len:234 (-) Transcript_13103:74-775(-)
MAELKTQLGAEDDEDEPEYLQYKIILLGDGAVGKTSLATRFTEDYFATRYKQTIGLDFFVKRVSLPGDVHVCMQIWDIGGQSIGGKMVSNYIHGSHAVVLCYDITNYQSFQHLEDWLCLVKRTFDKETTPYLAIMANKNDLSHMCAVKADKHKLFADENDLYSFFVSARTGDQVQPSFYQIAADLAGIKLTKPELEVAQRPLKAEIINHQRNDPAHKEVNAESVAVAKKCCIM